LCSLCVVCLHALRLPRRARRRVVAGRIGRRRAGTDKKRMPTGDSEAGRRVGQKSGDSCAYGFSPCEPSQANLQVKVPSEPH
jgi:hypothetical protein